MAHYLLSGMIVFIAGGFTFAGIAAKSDRVVAASFIASMIVMAFFAVTHQNDGYQYLFFDPICYVAGVFFGAVIDTEDSRHA